MSLMNINSRLKVGTRVTGGFAIVLLLLVVVAATGYIGLSTGRSTFGQYSTVAQNAVGVVDADRTFVGLRRNVLMYTSSGSEQALTTARDRLRTLRESLAALVAAATTAERREGLTRVAGLVDGYAATIDQIAQARGARERAVTEGMNVIGARMRAQLTELIQTTLAARNFEAAAFLGVGQEQLALARINALRYLAAPSAQTLETANQQIAAIAPALDRARTVLSAPDAQAKLGQIQEQVPQYAAAVRAAATAIGELDRLVNQVGAQAADRISEALTAIKTSQIAGLNSLRASSDAEMGMSITVALTLTAIAVVAGTLFAWLIGRGISGPVKKMTDSMTALAGGDLTVEIPARENTDEIGDMAKAVEVFKENMIKAREAAAREAEEVKIREARAKRIEELTQAFDAAASAALNTVSSASTELKASATSMTATAEETSRQATAVAAASEQASTNVTTVATATEELSSSIAEITRQVAHSAQIASKAVEESNRTTGAVKGLAEGATKIGDVVKLINDIASQTNLLALNATIEAARAGEAGKGFAVVAAEVKNLATQTAKATEEIAAQVNMIQAATNESVTAIEGIGGTIRQINEIATTIASAVEEQGAATQEITRNVQQASSGTREVSSNIGGVSQAAAETGTAATQVLSASDELSQQSEKLRQQVDHFLANVKAA